MSEYAGNAANVPWWKEPTKDQWYAYCAAWMGWTLDAFDFTVFLLIMAPIAQEFGVPLIDVTAIFSVTLVMRLGGATASGWLADRLGRRAPLMISILWYSVCNFLAGFSPSFIFLFVIRAILGIGMGAEWPAGAALAMESWPARSRGLMSGVLQGSWGLGFALSAPGLRLPVRTVGSVAQGLRVARDADPGRATGAGLRLDPHVRERARGLGGKQEDPERDAKAGHPATVRHLQAQVSVQHPHGLPVDGRELLHLLRGLGHARHLSDKGTGLDAGPGVGSGVLGQHPHVRRLHLLGRGVGTRRTALGADDPHDHRLVHHSAVYHAGRPDACSSGSSCCSSVSSAARMP